MHFHTRGEADGAKLRRSRALVFADARGSRREPPMARSFFMGTDAELYTGSANFSTKISATPTAYGLVAAQATAYGTLNTNYASAYTASQALSTRTKSSVASKNASKILLKAMASDLAKIIDGTSTVTDAQKLDLGLNVRATPTPVGPPGTPTDFNVQLLVDGTLVLTWKCQNPTGSVGTLYQLNRKVDAETEFTYIGGVGTKKFTDATVPAGAKTITYQIQAVRSTAVGEPAQFNVNFGVSGGGEVTASIEAPPAPRMAA